ncbi:MAG TPA: hypothetical protein VKF32_00490 [Thermoanaerobaculia bacterium]|nr:hypothetical protein [Thermoanaerobaculia bacterium]
MLTTRRLGAAGAAFALVLARETFAQAPPRSEVELPLPIYDALRASAKASRGETAEAKKPNVPYASTRLVRASVGVTPDRRRASWSATFAVVSGGDEPPPVPLLVGAAPTGASLVQPPTARVDSGPAGARLVVEAAGAWQVTLSGELVGQKDEAGGFVFLLPRLASAPAAFDVTLPEGMTATIDGRPLIAVHDAARAALASGERGATLVVKRARRIDGGPASVSGTLAAVERVSEGGVRTEVKLTLRVVQGLLVSRALRLPGTSLVSATGPVIASEPDASGRVMVRFEPPVRTGEEISATLSFLATRGPAQETLAPAYPELESTVEDRLERTLAVVAEGGLLAEAHDEEDWTPRDGAPEANAALDDLVLSWKARVEAPRPPRLTLRRLKALAVASALARVSLTAYVGETGQTKTLLVADVRTRGRSALTFRVPKGASLLAARVDGAATVVSRPQDERLEVPIRGNSGRTRIELLLGGAVAPPRAGQKLEVPMPAPEEPIERASLALVLPVGLAVKEEGKKVPPPAEAPPPLAPRPPEASAADRDALVFVDALASADARATAETVWSPDAVLPGAPEAYTTDLADLGEGVPPLLVTLVERKDPDGWH